MGVRGLRGVGVAVVSCQVYLYQEEVCLGPKQEHEVKVFSLVFPEHLVFYFSW